MKGYTPPEPYNYPHSMPFVSGGEVTVKLRPPKMIIKIYGKPNCPWCDRAKALAEENKLEVEYVNIVEAGIDGAKLSEICGELVRTVPQIFVDDVFIKGGYEGLKKHLAPEIPEAAAE